MRASTDVEKKKDRKRRSDSLWRSMVVESTLMNRIAAVIGGVWMLAV